MSTKFIVITAMIGVIVIVSGGYVISQRNSDLTFLESFLAPTPPPPAEITNFELTTECARGFTATGQANESVRGVMIKISSKEQGNQTAYAELKDGHFEILKSLPKGSYEYTVEFWDRRGKEFILETGRFYIGDCGPGVQINELKVKRTGVSEYSDFDNLDLFLIDKEGALPPADNAQQKISGDNIPGQTSSAASFRVRYVCNTASEQAEGGFTDYRIDGYSEILDDVFNVNGEQIYYPGVRDGVMSIDSSCPSEEGYRICKNILTGQPTTSLNIVKEYSFPRGFDWDRDNVVLSDDFFEMGEGWQSCR